ncbi:MAG: class I SAM-dependent methyltransferase [Candidatus Falkowbacteria bacterium]
MTFLIIIEIILAVLLIFLGMQFFNILFRGFAPFISTELDVVKKIIDNLDLKDNALVYELGCGKAGFLREFRKRHKNAKLVGVEYSFLPWLIAKIQTSLINNKINCKK